MDIYIFIIIVIIIINIFAKKKYIYICYIFIYATYPIWVIYIYVYTLYAICAPAQVPPFDWKHAQLDEVRQFLIQEAAAGRFVPSTNLTL